MTFLPRWSWSGEENCLESDHYWSVLSEWPVATGQLIGISCDNVINIGNVGDKIIITINVKNTNYTHNLWGLKLLLDHETVNGLNATFFTRYDPTLFMLYTMPYAYYRNLIQTVEQAILFFVHWLPLITDGKLHKKIQFPLNILMYCLVLLVWTWTKTNQEFLISFFIPTMRQLKRLLVSIFVELDQDQNVKKCYSWWHLRKPVQQWLIETSSYK